MLGFALGDAVSELKKAGYDVAVVEVSAKKRIDGGEGRVIRQRKLQDGRIELSYSLFHTDIYSRA
ncbi:MAG: hypothetical protein ACLVML_03820 [Candidatus Gastranaerophilaceae bacterium]|nr:hypothetical protein [Christensenellales bacterium]